MADDQQTRTMIPVAPDPARRGGRPRAPEPGVTLCVWVSASEYDRLHRLAVEHRMSLSALTRRLLLIDLHE